MRYGYWPKHTSLQHESVGAVVRRLWHPSVSAHSICAHLSGQSLRSHSTIPDCKLIVNIIATVLLLASYMYIV